MDRKPLLIAASALLLSLAAGSVHASFTQQGAKLVGTGAVGNTVFQGLAVAVSADGNTAVVGGYADDSAVGAAWVFTRSGGAWSQQGTKLVGTGATGPAYQGSSVALSADGNTAVVGGFGDNSNVGAAWVYTRSGGVWSQHGTKLVGTGATGGARQGYCVALSADGNTVVVGGYADNNDAGAAWVFTRGGGVWTQQGAKLVGTGAGNGASQGWSVALSADGNTAVVGGYANNSGVGAAWIYTRSGGVWSQQGARLIGTGSSGTAFQGSSVAISADGNTAVVGGNNDNGGVGAAWVFARSGSVWSQQGAKLVGTGAVGAAQQGISVAMSADGNTAVVGGYGDNGSVGATWMYTRSGGVWSPLGAKLVGTGAAGAAYQGSSIALSADGNTAVVGGFQDNSGAGAAWVFVNPLNPNCRFASSVATFSTESSGHPAVRALGPPDFYPGYGDNPNAWSSNLADVQPEFLDLGFTAPARMNFVNVYETLAPGAIQSISAKNPYTGLFEAVWTGTPAAAPAVSRLFTATFPVTTFPVSEIRIDLASNVVAGFNEIDAVGIGYRDLTAASQWASSVVSVSSQNVAPHSAVGALGPPNVFPAYGDLGSTWASLTADGQREFLDLAFSPAAPINFVNVVETFNPGALDKVSVKNPNTGLFEIVWTGTAATAVPLSRIRTVSFPETRFRVGEVRLDFNSPAVAGWNEVDAVGIGRCACQASPVDVPVVRDAPAENAIEWARPNPFGTSIEIGFSLARAGRVKLDVFNVLGQRVASVLDRMLPAGRHDSRWDGRDADGRTVASGIYYLRVESAGLNGVRKVVKVE